MVRFLIINTVKSQSFGEGMVQIIYIFIVCIVIFVGAYYASRLLGNFQLNKNRAANLKIVEVISIGPQKTVQLIKVGSEYILVGVTKDHITFIKEISESNLDINLLQGNDQVVPFNKYLDQYFKKKNSNNKKDE